MSKNSFYSTELTLKKVNSKITAFKCGDHLSGFIVCASHESPYSVVLDGGHYLGEFHCEVCTLKAIAELSLEVESAHRNFGISYAAYKQALSYERTQHSTPWSWR